MAWIFNPDERGGANPWSLEWGTPDRFADAWYQRLHYPGYKGKKKPQTKSAPPVARTHSADATCRISVQTFESTTPHSNARLVNNRDVDDLLFDDTLNHAFVKIRWNVNEAPKECLVHAILNDPGKCKEMMRDVPAHDNTPFMSPYYDGDETMDGHPSPPIYNNYHDDDATTTTTDDATAADANRSSRCGPFRFTFFTSAKHPKAKIAPSYAGDAMMWLHFKGKKHV